MAVAYNQEADASGQCRVLAAEAGRDLQEEGVVLDLGEPADDADQDVVLASAQFVADDVAAPRPVVKGTQVQAEGDHRELVPATDAKLLMDFLELLGANYHNTIRHRPRQDFFDRQEKPGFPAAVIAVEDVAVIRVDHATRPWPPQKGRWGQPAVQQPGQAPDRAGLGGVGVNHVGAEAHKEAVQLPDGHQVLGADFAADFRYEEGLDPLGAGEAAHVVLAGRDGAGHEHRLKTGRPQPGGEPGHMPGDPAHV